MTYSFLDVVATITGPGGSVNMGAGSANAEEGISIEAVEETVSLQIGADGSVVHNLHASRAGRIHVRLLKTSPTNSQLMNLYNFQRTSGINIGQNTLVVNNPVTGDNYTCTQVSFARNPTNTYAKESTMIDWEFVASYVNQTLGALQG